MSVTRSVCWLKSIWAQVHLLKNLFLLWIFYWTVKLKRKEMKFLINFVIIASLMVLDVFALPQTYSELANAAKQTEQLYYSMDAPNLLPFENSYDKDNGRVEHEGYGSKIDSIYDGFHKKSAEIFNVTFCCARVPWTTLIIENCFRLLFSPNPSLMEFTMRAKKMVTTETSTVVWRRLLHPWCQLSRILSTNSLMLVARIEWLHLN